MPDQAPTGNDHIEVTLLLRAEFASTLRVVVASLGADAHFSIDEIDDLRLAVSEIFNIFADTCDKPGDRCSASFEVSSHAVKVRLSSTDLDAPFELDALATTILGSVVDEHTVDDSGVLVVKRAAESGR